MKTLLFTGANGFLGRNVVPLLKNNYKISTLDIANADIVANIAKEIPVLNEKFDTIFHAAGKAHFVPTSEHESQEFFDINYQGTVNLCCALEKSELPHNFIFISTVAVYGCENGYNISEEHPLNGTTVYAKSKIQAESFLTEWAKKHAVTLSILRPSLIAGENPPGNLGAMINAIKSGKYLSIGEANVQKSVLMVQDLANLVPLLEDKSGIYNICSDEQPSVKELEQLIIKQLQKSTIWAMPMRMARFAAKIGDLLKISFFNSQKLEKITSSLTFSNRKAKEELNWKPLNVLENFII